MKRINFNITDANYEFLKTTQLSLAEHIRRALEPYIAYLKNLNAAASQSKVKNYYNNPCSKGKCNICRK